MQEHGRVLIVEDEKDISRLMALHLQREGYEVTEAENGEEALHLLEDRRFQLLVLDWMLPGLSGLDLCKKLRAMDEGSPSAKAPVLMVTARAQSADIILGLETGADDYLTKPFELPVFLARVRALLRRLPEESASGRRLKIGALELDLESHIASCDGEEISLTPSEFKLVSALMQNQGRVLTRAQLIDLVQGEGINVTERTIDTHVFGLRKKLKRSADVIETIRGIGYRVKSQS